MAAKVEPFKSFGIAWEEPTRTNNVYYYMNPIFINCHVLGCFPYDGKMRSSYPRIIMAVLFMFMMASTGAIYAYRSFGIPHSTTANAIVYMSIVVLALFCTLLVVFFTILQRKTLITVLDRIRAVDAKLLTMGVLYKYDRKEILSEIFLRWFFKTCMVVFDWIVYEQSISDICGPCLITSLYYSYFVIYNFQHQYTAIMKVVSRHLSLLNKYAVVHAGSKEIINRFIEIHYELCEICQLVNEWFSPQLLFVCSLVFLATTLNLNAMFMALISFLDPLPPQITIFISSTFWVSARLYEMWEIFDVCTKTEQNAEDFGGSLSKLMINEEMSNENELLDIHFHIQPKLSITASGFFRLNNSLFQSMLASATTYIVIIIQVQPQMQGIVCPDDIFNTTAPVSS